MPDATEGAEAAREEVLELVERWRATLHTIEGEAHHARPLVERALADAASTDPYHDLERTLRRAMPRASRVSSAVEDLVARVSGLRADWVAERRYEPDEVRALVVALAANVADDPRGVARRWLGELFDALDARRWDVVQVLANDDIAWPEDLAGGVRAVREGLRAWDEGDYDAGRLTMDALAGGELDGLAEVLTPELRSRAHRLVAWISLRRLGDRGAALESLEQAVRAYPRGGRMLAERAAYFLFVGELDRGAADAQHAIERAFDGSTGHFELGIWAELTGDYSGADELYRRGLERVSSFEIARLHKRAAILDPPGRLLLAGAERLLEVGRPAWALELAREALAVEVRGQQPHPEAAVHRVRSTALEAMGGDMREAAAAAMESGRLELWNGEPQRAIQQLERAIALDDSLEETGWVLADALLSTSFPLGENLPVFGSVSSARDRWEGWKQKVGPPRRETSWAYLTRAIVEDLMTQRPGTDRSAGIWESLAYVERALVHDDVDAQRWGYAAQYLRYAGLDELAFEAASRGYELSAGDRQVLAERLPLLINRGEFDAAEMAADDLISMFGADPWVAAIQAWIAMHSGRFKEALELLELPIAEGNDPGWYYEMRAVSHSGLEDLPAAREDYRSLRAEAPVIDGITKCRVAIAEICLGDRTSADGWLAAADEDPTTHRGTYLAASALAAFAADQPERAAELLEEAVLGTRSIVELDHLLTETKLHLKVLQGKDPPDGTLARIENEVATARRTALEADPVTPDSELEEGLGEHDRGHAGPDLSPAEMALIAVSSRRHVRTGSLAEAAAGYERLRESRFEPEATIALTQVLRRASTAAADAGEVETVRDACRRLEELGATTPIRGALAVADALRVAGQLDEAREHVAASASHAAVDSEVIEVERRLGSLSAELGDLDAANRHFRNALAVAESSGDAAVGGQIEIRLALIASLARDEAAAKRHVDAALAHWESAGAVDPAASLLEEVRQLRRRALLERHWSRVAADALNWIETTLERHAAREPQPA
jgi:tetratricopeptide (TPR) repeat protein